MIGQGWGRGVLRYRLISPILLLLLGWTLACSGQDDMQEDFGRQLPRIAATSAEESLARFHVQPGFEMQLVAAEPLVASPVAIAWDAAGRMFVCEMRGYSEQRDEALSRIRILEDTDQDGIYDTSQIFADGLLWPTAILPFDGGLLVGDAPNILYLRDNDGDGKADYRHVVLTGFGTSNVQGLLNSFRWGLDQRVHVACSSVGGRVHRPDQDPEQAVDLRGQDLAFDPVTGQFTLTSAAAQHGMCFDDWGRKFTCSNSDHLQQVMYEDRYVGRNPYLAAPGGRVSIASDGPQAEVFRTSPVEPWRIVRTQLRVNGVVPGPIEGGGRAAGYFTGATGVTIYRGDAWPANWKGLAVVGDVGSNLIHRKILERHGVVMAGQRIDSKSELVTSDDIWFRPAQFANAPDGSLYVIDVCREVIEHPKSLPPMIKKHLDLTAGRDRGRIYRLAQEGFQYRATPNLQKAETEQLVAMLDHGNAWHRETASRLLFQRKPAEAVGMLQEKVRTGDQALGRLHALAILSALGHLDADTLIVALQDQQPMVRRWAVRCCETVPMEEPLIQTLQSILEDPDLEVRYQLAFTLGELPITDRSGWLAQILSQSPDDRWIALAVQSSLHLGADAFLKQWWQRSDRSSLEHWPWLDRMLLQVGQQSDPEKISELVPLLESLPRKHWQKLQWIGQLRTGFQRRKDQDPVVNQVLQTACDQWVNDVQEVVRQGALNDRLPAIQSLQFAAWEQAGGSLSECLQPTQPIEVQLAAMEAIGHYQEAEVAEVLLKEWAGYSPQVRRQAVRHLLNLPHRTLALLAAMEAGQVALSDVGMAALQEAGRSRDPQVKQRALALLQSSVDPDREAVFRRYEAAWKLQEPAYADVGRELFKKHCAGCHQWQSTGHPVGPNLATMQNRGIESLLWNVLDPNREVNPEYVNYLVQTTDGRIHSGLIANESASSVMLKQAEGKEVVLLRDQIERLESTGKSLMPEGLERELSPSQMRDLFSFLLESPAEAGGQ